MESFLIFTDAATSAKAHIAVGVFLIIEKKVFENYAACNADILQQKIIDNIIFKTYASKKSTWSEINTVIEALEFIYSLSNQKQKVEIYTDCLSLCDLLGRRKEKLLFNNFITRTGKVLQNADLYRKLYLIAEKFEIKTIKIKGHQAKSNNVTAAEKIFAVIDKLSRKKLRLALENNIL